MGIFGKFGAVFAAMPSPVLGGMQTFLYSTIAISGMRILATIVWTRRNRFILSAAFGLGLLDIVVCYRSTPIETWLLTCSCIIGAGVVLVSAGLQWRQRTARRVSGRSQFDG